MQGCLPDSGGAPPGMITYILSSTDIGGWWKVFHVPTSGAVHFNGIIPPWET